MSASSALTMEAVFFSETFVSSCKSTQRYNQEDQYRHLHRRENLKSHMVGMFSEPVNKAAVRLGQTWTLRLAQPGGRGTWDFSPLPPFYLKTEAEFNFRNVKVSWFYNLDDGQSPKEQFYFL
jgi:hypothetical protein